MLRHGGDLGDDGLARPLNTKYFCKLLQVLRAGFADAEDCDFFAFDLPLPLGVGFTSSSKSPASEPGRGEAVFPKSDPSLVAGAGA